MRNKTEDILEPMQKKELDSIISEITELAKSITKDFSENPTDISGSTIQIH